MRPGEAEAEAAALALRTIKDCLARQSPGSHEIGVLVNGRREALTLPGAAVEMLAFILTQLADGCGVAVLSSEADLSMQQAADLLNVSEPHLGCLLNGGTIPHRTVGGRRRIRVQDLLDHKRRDDSERRAAADDLSALTQDLGLT